jgi:hypothetical protein
MNSLLDKITQFYLTSGDFNGYPVSKILVECGEEAGRQYVRELVEAGLVSIVFGDRHPNAHIRAFPDEPIDRQLEKLGVQDLAYACAYPAARHLEAAVDRKSFADRPYALELALGAAQLSHRAFDLHILEFYRNDPRYSYVCDDIHGTISAVAEEGLRESDQTFLKSFGFAYDEEGGRYVAVFLWDLFKLSPEHQQFWKTREIAGPTSLHPDYYRTQIIGDWPERLSIYEAFTLELQTINRMSTAMGKAALFRNDFTGPNRPKAFASLLRPTVREFNDFVRLLDSMISDNINRDFFRGAISLESEKERPDGRVEVRQKGTIQLLEEWLRSRVRLRDPAPMEAMFSEFKNVRKLRNKPAHAPIEDAFSREIVNEQRNFMIRVYKAVRTLRLILANHPAAKDVEVDELLRKGMIWTK